jgi:hypothetical protein
LEDVIGLVACDCRRKVYGSAVRDTVLGLLVHGFPFKVTAVEFCIQKYCTVYGELLGETIPLSKPVQKLAMDCRQQNNHS